MSKEQEGNPNEKKEGCLNRRNVEKILSKEEIKNFCLKPGKNLSPEFSKLLSFETLDATEEQRLFLNGLSISIYNTVKNPEINLLSAGGNMRTVSEKEMPTIKHVVDNVAAAIDRYASNKVTDSNFMKNFKGLDRD